MIALTHFNDFITAAIAVNFYWQSNIPSWRIFCHCLGHHVGSVAWTIIFLPIMLFKIPLGWLDWLIDSKNPNVLQRCIRCMFAPCFWCYDKFLDRIDSGFFSITYLGVQNFCPASNRLFYLNEKYIDKTSTMVMVGKFFEFAGKAFVSIGGTVFAYFLYKNNLAYQQNISNVLLFFVVCFFASYIIGSLFINLFSTTYYAILVCFLVELNIFQTSGIQVTKCPTEIMQVLRNIETISEGHTNYRRLN